MDPKINENLPSITNYKQTLQKFTLRKNSFDEEKMEDSLTDMWKNVLTV